MDMNSILDLRKDPLAITGWALVVLMLVADATGHRIVNPAIFGFGFYALVAIFRSMRADSGETQRVVGLGVLLLVALWMWYQAEVRREDFIAQLEHFCARDASADPGVDRPPEAPQILRFSAVPFDAPLPYTAQIEWEVRGEVDSIRLEGAADEVLDSPSGTRSLEVRAPTALVDQAGGHFLAAAGFAGDVDRRLAARDLVDHPADALDQGACAEQFPRRAPITEIPPARILSDSTDTSGTTSVDTFGDFNLSYEGCPPNQLTGQPECDQKQVVGHSRYVAWTNLPGPVGKHDPIRSQIATTEWTWGGYKDVTWLRAEGGEMGEEQWLQPQRRTIGINFGLAEASRARVLMLVNAAHEPVSFQLPEALEGWRLLFDTALEARGEEPIPAACFHAAYQLESLSIVLLEA